jgi:hypothetical protein
MSDRPKRRELTEEEKRQRAALKRRLAGRPRKPSREIFKDFGTPTLTETTEAGQPRAIQEQGGDK